MEDMKGDMGGAACVVGLMHALAARKAKVNAVGAIGLVENMPDGNAQRPGDIVMTQISHYGCLQNLSADPEVDEIGSCRLIEGQILFVRRRGRRIFH